MQRRILIFISNKTDIPYHNTYKWIILSKIGQNVPKYEFGNILCYNMPQEEVARLQGKQPKILRDFMIYLTTIKGKSMRTRKEYEYDLTLFFRFLKITYEDLEIEKN